LVWRKTSIFLNYINKKFIIKVKNMTEYYENNLYKTEIKEIVNYSLLDILKDKVFVIAGARGMICSELIDTIMYANLNYGLNCKIYGIVRNMQAAEYRFKAYKKSIYFQLVQADINKDVINIDKDVDFFIQGASNTHPVYYSIYPIDTILTNTVGTNRMLEFASKHRCKRFLFLSSVEVYGENRGDIDKFTEGYLGYLNCNTLRAGYSEAKRLGEALCQAYIAEKGLDCVIPRIARAYGAGLLKEDSKALSQFIHNALKGEDIVLKSKGDQFYSYVYIADIVSALLFLIANGKTGEAYNLSGIESDITLAKLADYIANFVGTRVVYDIPSEQEAAGYSKATKAILDTKKIENLGWHSRYSIREGIKRTLQIQGIN